MKYSSQRQNRFRSKSYSLRSSNGPRRAKKFQIAFNPFEQVKNTVSEEVEKYTASHSFQDFPIREELKKNIINKNYTTPTPIQDQAILPMLEGKDLIGIANTGTGKTAAFLIPLVNKAFSNPNQKVLIVVPTRELAVQIQDEFREFTRGMNMYSVLCIGGANIQRQKQELKRGCHFVVGTPGRLKDLAQQRILKLEIFNNVVLDEVDLMVDIGFIHDVKYLISGLSQNRQSLFFSATVNSKVKEILNSFVRNPVTVSVKTQETVSNIHQDIIKVDHKNKKIEQLHNLLVQKDFEKVLIFGKSKWEVQRLSDELVRRGFKADAIHGNKRQNQRQRALKNFKDNVIHILLATDVAARGLDIDNVSHVINYDMPLSYEDYIHRIGRTGRANKKGVALTFV